MTVSNLCGIINLIEECIFKIFWLLQDESTLFPSATSSLVDIITSFWQFSLVDFFVPLRFNLSSSNLQQILLGNSRPLLLRQFMPEGREEKCNAWWRGAPGYAASTTIFYFCDRPRPLSPSRRLPEGRGGGTCVPVRCCGKCSSALNLRSFLLHSSSTSVAVSSSAGWSRDDCASSKFIKTLGCATHQRPAELLSFFFYLHGHLLLNVFIIINYITL